MKDAPAAAAESRTLSIMNYRTGRHIRLNITQKINYMSTIKPAYVA
jgi:hypothetical protein